MVPEGNFVTFVKRIGNRLARPDILFWLLPLLMGLLIMGTVAQKTIGLYAAQERYFDSWIVLIGPIPFPGGLTLIGLFFINLLCKFIFRSEWTKEKAGTILSHFGVIILVLGGLLAVMTSREGFLVIPQGESRNYIEDYHARNLVIRKTENGQDTTLIAIPHDQLKDGTHISDAGLPFTLTVTTYCFNCSISRRPEDRQENWTSPGKFMMLSSGEADPQDEKNMTGVEFEIKGAGDLDGNYLTFDGFPKPPQLDIKDAIYTITMERVRRPLPFAVELESFQRDMHPGTEMARAFTSKIKISDPQTGTVFPATIEMNEPLRYRGLTLYQSSFDLSGDKAQTVLAVVENKGRVFPYIASFIIALGLIIHLINRMKRLSKPAKADRA